LSFCFVLEGLLDPGKPTLIEVKAIDASRTDDAGGADASCGPRAYFYLILVPVRSFPPECDLDAQHS
jgi:hypothetical protein